MKSLLIPWVDWGNGIVMIAVFAIVVIVLIVVMVNLMNSGKSKDQE